MATGLLEVGDPGLRMARALLRYFQFPLEPVVAMPGVQPAREAL